MEFVVGGKDDPTRMKYLPTTDDRRQFVRPQGSQLAKQKGSLKLLPQRNRQRAYIRSIDSPIATVNRDGFQRLKLREHCCGGFRAPARQPWISVCRISHEREVIGDRLRFHTELFTTPVSSIVSGVAGSAAPRAYRSHIVADPCPGCR